MNIVYIANARIPTEKAYGYQIAKICEALSGLGAHVELWVPTRRNEIKKDLFDFYGVKKVFSVRRITCPDIIANSRFLGPLGFYLQSFIFFLRLLFERPAKESWVMTRNAEIAWLFHLKGHKTVYYAHFWPEGKNGLFRYFLREADAILLNSHGTKEAFMKHELNAVAVIPNGVDLDDFSFTETKGELRKELKLPPKKIALYAGHLYAWKGIDVLFQAAELLKDTPDVMFVLVGGTSADYEARMREIEQKGLTNIILTGYKQKTLIPKYLSAADMLLLPNAPVSTESISYTSPIKMFEYMASGTPIVASNLPSTREVLNEQNALLVEAGNAAAFVRGIRTIIRDQTAAQRLSEQARRDAARYTWRSRAEDILAFLNTR